MFYVFYYVLCILCLSLCAFLDKFPFGHNKVEVEAEVNIKKTDGSDIVKICTTTTKRGAEFVMSRSENK